MQIPKNVVQAGEVDSCHKIYIEDYVNTFLKQYQTDSADFCLYGKSEQEDGISYYFIYGAVREDTGWETMQARYFPGASRIGEATCDREESWLFFEDGYAAALDGYFIFYEQNEDMQSYLIAMHQNQPGEKTVEVRPRAAGRRENGQGGSGAYINIHTDSLREKKIQSATAIPESKEPRRIRHKPQGFDSGTEKGGEEKALHAAQLRRPSGRRKEKMPPFFTGRAAGLALLLLLCVTGIASINRYRDMQEVGNFFAETARGLVGGEEETQSEARESGQSGFIIEERQLPASENQQENATFPVFASIEEQREGNNEPMTEEGQAPADTQEASGEDISRPSETAAEEETETTENRPAGQESGAGQEEAENGIETAEEEEKAAPVSEAGPVTYTVQEGDSLAIICRRRYGNTDRVDEIISINDFEDPNHLVPGQKILLPN